MSHIAIAYIPLVIVTVLGLIVALAGAPWQNRWRGLRRGQVMFGAAVALFALAFMAHDYYGLVLPGDRHLQELCRAAAARSVAVEPAYTVRRIHVEKDSNCGQVCAENLLRRWTDLHIAVHRGGFLSPQATQIRAILDKGVAERLELSVAPAGSAGCYRPLEKDSAYCLKVAPDASEPADRDVKFETRRFETRDGIFRTRRSQNVVTGRTGETLFYNESVYFDDVRTWSSSMYYSDFWPGRYSCKPELPYKTAEEILKPMLGPERRSPAATP